MPAADSALTPRMRAISGRGHRLQIGDDRQRLGLRGGQRRRARLGQQPPRGPLGLGMAAQRVAAGQLAHDEPAALEVIVLAQPLERGDDLVQLGAGGIRQRRRRHRVGAEEQQRLDRALQLGGHAVSLCAAEARPLIVISANGSS